MEFVPQRVYDIGGRKLHVYDEIFSPEQIQNFANIVCQLNFQRRQSFDRELNVPIDNGKFCQAPFLYPVTESLFHSAGKSQFGIIDPSVCLSHVYAAAMNADSCGTVHQDIDLVEGITFLYYANAIWRGKWGAETVFYDQNLDAVAAVTPKPGRLVMFHSNLFHRAGVPHPDTPTYRYTVSVFYYPSTREVSGPAAVEKEAAPV